MAALSTSDGAVVLTDGLHQSASESNAWSKPQGAEKRGPPVVVL